MSELQAIAAVAALPTAIASLVTTFYLLRRRGQQADADIGKTDADANAIAVATVLKVNNELREEHDRMVERVAEIPQLRERIEALEEENRRLAEEVDDVLIIGSDLILQMMRHGIAPGISHLPDRYREVLAERAGIMSTPRNRNPDQ